MKIKDLQTPGLRDWVRARHKLKFLEETDDISVRNVSPGDWVTVHPVSGVLDQAKTEKELLLKLHDGEYIFRYKAPEPVARQRKVTSEKEDDGYVNKLLYSTKQETFILQFRVNSQ